jgi:hypothetical protein
VTGTYATGVTFKILPQRDLDAQICTWLDHGSPNQQRPHQVLRQKPLVPIAAAKSHVFEPNGLTANGFNHSTKVWWVFQGLGYGP